MECCCPNPLVVVPNKCVPVGTYRAGAVLTPQMPAKSKILKFLSGHEVIKLKLNRHTDWRSYSLEGNYIAGNHVFIHSAGGETPKGLS